MVSESVNYITQVLSFCLCIIDHENYWFFFQSCQAKIKVKKLIITAHFIFIHESVSVLVLVNTNNSSI